MYANHDYAVRLLHEERASRFVAEAAAGRLVRTARRAGRHAPRGGATPLTPVSLRMLDGATNDHRAAA